MKNLVKKLLASLQILAMVAMIFPIYGLQHTHAAGDDDNDGIPNELECKKSSTVNFSVESDQKLKFTNFPINRGDIVTFNFGASNLTPFTATNGPSSGKLINDGVYVNVASKLLVRPDGEIYVNGSYRTTADIWTQSMISNDGRPDLGFPYLSYIAFVDRNNDGSYTQGTDELIGNIKDGDTYSVINNGNIYAFFNDYPYHDNQGEIPLTITTACDSDGDGTPDYLDTDSDNNGVDDSVEAGSDPLNPVDTDGDGTPDFQDNDNDNDGIPDIAECNPNFGINPITDLVLSGDANDLGNGEVRLTRDTGGVVGTLISKVNAKLDLNYDFSIKFNLYFGVKDSAGADGIVFVLHNDARGENARGSGGSGIGSQGIANAIGIEYDTITNADGADINNDHMQFKDITKNIAATESNLSGIGDLGNVEDGKYHQTTITWNKGTSTFTSTIETDSGTKTVSYTNSNMTSIFDNKSKVFWGFTAGTGYNSNEHKVKDIQISSKVCTLDSDNDGLINSSDTDSDNDGISDKEEFGNDMNNPVDTDGDGIPDYLDTDSDGDTILDSEEAGDTDPSTPPVDTDGDGTPDYLDTDSDNDTLPDSAEAGDTNLNTPPVDTNNDGTADYRSPANDFDNDGISDSNEIGNDLNNPVDTDGDGTPDYQDTDSDNDGHPDKTDPNRIQIVTNNDTAKVVIKQNNSINILSNDDFLKNTDGNTLGKITITSTVNSTAGGTISFDTDGGTLNYRPLESELGKEVAIEYQVCNITVTPSVCSSSLVTISVTAKPVITTHNEIINQGTHFNLKSLIDTGTDFEDGNIINNVIITSNGGFRSTVPGTYTITFSLTDSDGNTTTETAGVRVREKYKSPNEEVFNLSSNNNVNIEEDTSTLEETDIDLNAAADTITTDEGDLNMEQLKKIFKQQQAQEVTKNIHMRKPTSDFSPVSPIHLKVGASEIEKYTKNLPNTGVMTGIEIQERAGVAGAGMRSLIDITLPDEQYFKLAGSTNPAMNYWLRALPKEDRSAQRYIVLPTQGLVMPVNTVEKTSDTYRKYIKGEDQHFREYLKTGAVEIPGTSSRDYGEVGNKVIAGHSSDWYSGTSRYKTHFQQIIALEETEEVWIFEKLGNGSFKRYIYKVQKSYNTDKDDIDVLKPSNRKELTLITCTPIGGATGRWVVKALFESSAD